MGTKQVQNKGMKEGLVWTGYETRKTADRSDGTKDRRKTRRKKEELGYAERTRKLWEIERWRRTGGGNFRVL